MIIEIGWIKFWLYWVVARSQQYLKMIKALTLSNFSHFLFLFMSDEKKIDQKDVIIGHTIY